MNRSVLNRETAVVGVLVAASLLIGAAPARADGNLQNLNHIIVLMQENHSFDNYFGILPYVTGSPYHSAKGSGKKRACKATDNTCVDGLSCSIVKKTGALKCTNSNKDEGTSKVKSFHDASYCIGPDLDHGWLGTHKEINFAKPNATLKSPKSDGFVRQNDDSDQSDNGVETPTDDDTMGYYTDTDLPFYFGVAQTFAISDRYFCSVLGPTFPNRAFLAAATSFGHLTTSEIIPPTGPYQPITGTIFDLLNQNSVTWADYYSDLPYSLIFQPASSHQRTLAQFAADAAANQLPAVSFIDPSVGASQLINGAFFETDEHPPANIRAGQYFVAQIAATLRNSPSWNDSLLIVTYDEHGGFYDHAAPPAAPQGGALTPDGIEPGRCADLSDPPASQQPGGGINCTISATSAAPALCPTFSPSAPYPTTCAGFEQLGIRVPYVAISPFAKAHYVSHTVGDHASILALIEKRFLGGASMTARDANANTLEDMFDFDQSPSLDATLPTAPLPNTSDPGCPFTSP